MKKFLRLLLCTLLCIALCAAATAAIMLPKSLTMISDEAFAGDSSITGRVNIGSPVVHVGDRAFANTGVTVLDFGRTVRYIGTDVAQGSNALYAIVRNRNAEVAEGAFQGVGYVFAPSGSPLFAAAGTKGEPLEYVIEYEGFLYITHADENGNSYVELLCAHDPSAVSGEITIPRHVDGVPVTVLSEHAFQACSGVSTVHYPAEALYPEENLWALGLVLSPYETVQAEPVKPSEKDAERTDFASLTLPAGVSIELDRPEHMWDDHLHLTKWYSSDDSIVSVNQNGVITTKQKGQAAITFMFRTSEKVEYVVYQISVEDLILNVNSVDNSLEMAVGQQTLFLGGYSTNMSTANYLTEAFVSDNEDVVVINDGGVVTAKAAGTANIIYTASFGDVSKSVTVPVMVRENVLALNVTTLGGFVGVPEKLAVMGAQPTDAIEWRSENEELVQVDSNGQLTLLKEGETSVIAIVTDVNGKETQLVCDLYISTMNNYFTDPAFMRDEEDNYLVTKGESGHTGVYFWFSRNFSTPEELYPVVTSQSSDETILKVYDDRTFEALGTGTVTVTNRASYMGREYETSYNVTVIQPILFRTPEEAVELYPSQVEREMGFELDSAYPIVGWQYTSSNPDVATVRPDNNVIAVAPGETIITCTVTDELGRKEVSQRKVIVLNTRAYILPEETTIALDESMQLNFGVKDIPEGMGLDGYDLRSMNDKVVTVDPETGMVMAQGVGSTWVVYDAYVRDHENDENSFELQAKAKITVSSEGHPFSLSETELHLRQAHTHQLELIMHEYVKPESVTWESSRDSVSIDRSGVVSINHQATESLPYDEPAVLTCTMVIGGKSYTAYCEVYEVYGDVAAWMPGDMRLAVDESTDILPILCTSDFDSERYTFEWSVQNDAILGVTPSEDGYSARITALAPGQSTVRVFVYNNTTGQLDFADSTLVYVDIAAPDFEKVSLDRDTYYLVLDADGPDRDWPFAELVPEPQADYEGMVYFESSNEDIFVIDDENCIIPVHPGKATLTVRVGGYPELVDTAEVVVFAPHLELSTGEEAVRTNQKIAAVVKGLPEGFEPEITYWGADGVGFDVYNPEVTTADVVLYDHGDVRIWADVCYEDFAFSVSASTFCDPEQPCVSNHYLRLNPEDYYHIWPENFDGEIVKVVPQGEEEIVTWEFEDGAVVFTAVSLGQNTYELVYATDDSDIVVPVHIEVAEPEWALREIHVPDVLTAGSFYHLNAWVECNGDIWPELEWSWTGDVDALERWDDYTVLVNAAGRITLTCTATRGDETQTLTKDITILEPAFHLNIMWPEGRPGAVREIFLLSNRGIMLPEDADVEWFSDDESLITLEEVDPQVTVDPEDGTKYVYHRANIHVVGDEGDVRFGAKVTLTNEDGTQQDYYATRTYHIISDEEIYLNVDYFDHPFEMGTKSYGMANSLVADFGFDTNESLDNLTVKWSIDNKNIATIRNSQIIDEENRLQAILDAHEPGETTLRLKVTVGAGEHVRVEEREVPIYVCDTKLEIHSDDAEITFNVGDTHYLHRHYEQNDEGLTMWNPVIWKSSDPSVITVTSDGQIRAVAPGEATITHEIWMSGRHAEDDFVEYVTNELAASFEFAVTVEDSFRFEDGAVLNIINGQTHTLTPVVPEGWKLDSIGWQSDNADIADVVNDENGMQLVVEAKCGGIVRIHYHADIVQDVEENPEWRGYDGHFDVVIPYTDEPLTLKDAFVNLKPGEKYKVEMITPTQYDSVTWESADENIVSVTEDGTLQAGFIPEHMEPVYVWCHVTVGEETFTAGVLVQVERASIQITDIPDVIDTGIYEQVFVPVSIVAGDGVTYEVSFESDDPSIAELGMWSEAEVYVEGYKTGVTDVHYVVKASDGVTYTATMRVYVNTERPAMDSLELANVILMNMGDNRKLWIPYEFKPFDADAGIIHFKNGQGIELRDHALLEAYEPGVYEVFMFVEGHDEWNTSVPVIVLPEHVTFTGMADDLIRVGKKHSVQLGIEESGMWADLEQKPELVYECYHDGNRVSVSSDGFITAHEEGFYDVWLRIRAGMDQEISYNYSFRASNPPIPENNAGELDVEQRMNVIAIGERLGLGWPVERPEGSDILVTWSSSDERVATVSQDGVVTARDFGLANIIFTLRTNEGVKYAVYTVEVRDVEAEIHTERDHYELTVGQTNPLRWGIDGNTDFNQADFAYRFVSSDENVVKVDKEGNMTAVGLGEDGEGNAQITLFVTYGDHQWNYDIHVHVSSEEKLHLNHSYLYLYGLESDTAQLTVENLPDGAAVVWYSENDDVVSVDETGLVTPQPVENMESFHIWADVIDANDEWITTLECPVTIADWDFHFEIYDAEWNEQEQPFYHTFAGSHLSDPGYRFPCYVSFSHYEHDEDWPEITLQSHNEEVLKFNDDNTFQALRALKKDEAPVEVSVTAVYKGQTITTSYWVVVEEEPEYVIMDVPDDYEDPFTLYVGQSDGLPVDIWSEYYGISSIVYDIEDPSVVKLGDDRMLTALKPGTTNVTITASTHMGHTNSRTFEVKVVEATPFIRFSGQEEAVDAIHLNVGDEVTLDMGVNAGEGVEVHEGGNVWINNNEVADFDHEQQKLIARMPGATTLFYEAGVDDRSVATSIPVIVHNDGNPRVWLASHPEAEPFEALTDITLTRPDERWYFFLRNNGIEPNHVEWEVQGYCVSMDYEEESGAYCVRYEHGTNRLDENISSIRVTAYYDDGEYTNWLQVTCLAPEVEVRMPSYQRLGSGDEATFWYDLTTALSADEYRLEWQSDDPNVVEINPETGVAFGVNPGVTNVNLWVYDNENNIITVGWTTVYVDLPIEPIGSARFSEEIYYLTTDEHRHSWRWADLHVEPNISYPHDSLIHFTNSNDTVLKLHEDGNMHGLEDGVAVIGFSIEGYPEFTDEATVVVMDPTLEVNVSDEDSLGIGSIFTATLSGIPELPEGAEVEVEWVIEGGDFDIISEEGNTVTFVVEHINPESGADVIARVHVRHWFDVEARAHVNGRESVGLEHLYLNMVPGDGARVYPAFDWEGATLEWFSANPEIADVSKSRNDEGWIDAIAPGSTTVTLRATWPDGNWVEACSTVFVHDELLLKIHEINIPTELNLEDGPVHLDAHVEHNCWNVDWEWTSSNPDVLRVVMEENLLVPISSGEAVITLKFTSRATEQVVEKSINVTVVEPDVRFAYRHVPMRPGESFVNEIIYGNGYSAEDVTNISVWIDDFCTAVLSEDKKSVEITIPENVFDLEGNPTGADFSIDVEFNSSDETIRCEGFVEFIRDEDVWVAIHHMDRNDEDFEMGLDGSFGAPKTMEFYARYDTNESDNNTVVSWIADQVEGENIISIDRVETRKEGMNAGESMVTITALKEGETTLRFIVESTVTGRRDERSCRVHVWDNFFRIVSDEPNVTMQVGEHRHMNYEYKHSEGGLGHWHPYVWTSSNPDVAVVMTDGKVSALKPGEITIRHEVYMEEVKVGEFDFNVTVEGFDFGFPAMMEVEGGAIEALVPDTSSLPEDAWLEIGWNSENDDIVSVQQNEEDGSWSFTALRPGATRLNYGGRVCYDEENAMEFGGSIYLVVSGDDAFKLNHQYAELKPNESMIFSYETDLEITHAEWFTDDGNVLGMETFTDEQGRLSAKVTAWERDWYSDPMFVWCFATDALGNQHFAQALVDAAEATVRIDDWNDLICLGVDDWHFVSANVRATVDHRIDVWSDDPTIAEFFLDEAKHYHVVGKKRGVTWVHFKVTEMNEDGSDGVSYQRNAEVFVDTDQPLLQGVDLPGVMLMDTNEQRERWLNINMIPWDASWTVRFRSEDEGIVSFEGDSHMMIAHRQGVTNIVVEADVFDENGNMSTNEYRMPVIVMDNVSVDGLTDDTIVAGQNAQLSVREITENELLTKLMEDGHLHVRYECHWDPEAVRVNENGRIETFDGHQGIVDVYITLRDDWGHEQHYDYSFGLVTPYMPEEEMTEIPMPVSKYTKAHGLQFQLDLPWQTYESMTTQFYSADERVATVSHDGTVTTHETGQAAITCVMRMHDGTICYGVTNVLVEEWNAEISLERDWYDLVVGQETALFYNYFTAWDHDDSQFDLWIEVDDGDGVISYDDEQAESWEKGVLTAHREGQARIHVYLNYKGHRVSEREITINVHSAEDGLYLSHYNLYTYSGLEAFTEDGSGLAHEISLWGELPEGWTTEWRVNDENAADLMVAENGLSVTLIPQNKDNSEYGHDTEVVCVFWENGEYRGETQCELHVSPFLFYFDKPEEPFFVTVGDGSFMTEAGQKFPVYIHYRHWANDPDDIYGFTATSSDPEVLSFDEKRAFTAHKEGEVTVTLEAWYKGFKQTTTYQVVVDPAEESGLNLRFNPIESITLNIGQERWLDGGYRNMQPASLHLISSDNDIVETFADGNYIVGRTPGKAEVSYFALDENGNVLDRVTIPVTVNGTAMEYEFEFGSIELAIGESADLPAITTVTDEEHPDKLFLDSHWNSLNSDIAFIGDDGRIWAQRKGDVSFVVEGHFPDGTPFKTTFPVTVTDAGNPMQLNESELFLSPGQTALLYLETEADEGTVNWWSSDDGCVSVNMIDDNPRLALVTVHHARSMYDRVIIYCGANVNGEYHEISCAFAPIPSDFSISLQDNLILNAGETQWLGREIRCDAPDHEFSVRWWTDEADPEHGPVVTVDENGNVTGHRHGIAAVHCRIFGVDQETGEEIFYAQADVPVFVDFVPDTPSELWLPEAIFLNAPGEHARQTETGIDRRNVIRAEYRWNLDLLDFQSSNGDVFTVNHTGNIQAVANGEATLTVTMRGFPNLKGVCRVVVGDFRPKDRREVALGEEFILELPNWPDLPYDHIHWGYAEQFELVSENGHPSAIFRANQPGEHHINVDVRINEYWHNNYDIAVKVAMPDVYIQPGDTEHLDMYVGQTRELNYEFETSLPVKSVLYTSTNPDVVKVNTFRGNVVAVAPGDAQILITVTDLKDQTYSGVVSNVHVAEATIHMPESISLGTEEQRVIEVGYNLPEGMSVVEEQMWTTTPGVAHIDMESRILTAEHEGVTTLVWEAKLSDDQLLRATCPVYTVHEDTTHRLSDNFLVLYGDQHYRLTSNAENVTWESSDENFVTVGEDGVLVVVDTSDDPSFRVTISCRDDDTGAMAFCEVQPIPSPVRMGGEQGVKILVGQSYNIYRELYLSSEMAFTEEWSSEDDQVVSVDQDGTIFGVAPSEGPVFIHCNLLDMEGNYLSHFTTEVTVVE